MNTAQQIRIGTPDGGHLTAEHYRAEGHDLTGAHGRPCIVMAHGVGATRDCGLGGFAGVLASAGTDVIAFDYRHFAESSGEPRQLVHLPRQIEDYQHAIGHARSLPGVDPDRIVVWGVSLSGGHVLRVAAEDHRIAAAISLTPAVDGTAAVWTMLRSHGLGHVVRLLRIGLADQVAALRRRPAVLAPIVGHPGEPAALCAPGAVRGMQRIAGPTWRNAVAARVLLQIGTYRPGAGAARLRCPVLMQIADGDQSAPPGAATSTATRARATVHHYPCDHFDVYPGAAHHDRVTQHQVAFLRRVLAPRAVVVP